MTDAYQPFGDDELEVDFSHPEESSSTAPLTASTVRPSESSASSSPKARATRRAAAAPATKEKKPGTSRLSTSPAVGPTAAAPVGAGGMRHVSFNDDAANGRTRYVNNTV